MTRLYEVELLLSHLEVITVHKDNSVTTHTTGVKCHKCAQMFKIINMRYCFKCDACLDDTCFKDHRCGFEFEMN